MPEVTRRGMFALFPGMGAVVIAGGCSPIADLQVPQAACPPVTSFNWARMELFRRGVVGEVGEDAFDCWFRSMELERLEGDKLTVSVPVLFLKRWVDAHYGRALLRGAQRMDARVEEVKIIVRKPRTAPLNVKAIV